MSGEPWAHRREEVFLLSGSFEEGFTESMTVTWILNDESAEKREDIQPA